MSLLRMCDGDKVDKNGLKLALKLGANPEDPIQADFDGSTPLALACKPCLDKDSCAQIPNVVTLVDILLKDGNAKDKANTSGEKLSVRIREHIGIDKTQDIGTTQKMQFLDYLKDRLERDGGNHDNRPIHDFNETPMNTIFKEFKDRMEETTARIIKRIEILKPSLRLCALCGEVLAAYSCSECQNPLFCEICAEAMRKTKSQNSQLNFKCAECKKPLRFEAMIWEPNIDAS